MIEDIDYFYSSMLIHNNYVSDNKQIQKVELFLMCWLNGLIGESGSDFTHEEAEKYMDYMYRKFKQDFDFRGVLYRGVVLDEKEKLKSNYLASFSSDVDVAEEFASPCKEGQKGFIFKTFANSAFDFSRFLRVVYEKTTNVEMQIVIDERIDEEEKLHIFNVNEADSNFVTRNVNL